MCPARRRARRTASALLEVAMESAVQEKCSYTMAVRGIEVWANLQLVFHYLQLLHAQRAHRVSG